MEINATAPHPWNKSKKLVGRWWGGNIWPHFCDNKKSHTKNAMLIFYVFLSFYKNVAPQFLISRRTVQIAPNFLHWNPTGHSKFHNTSNHPPPATDYSQTACTPLYPPVQAVPPPPYSCPPSPVPVTGVCYISLLWMCTLNTLTWPDQSWSTGWIEK